LLARLLRNSPADYEMKCGGGIIPSFFACLPPVQFFTTFMRPCAAEIFIYGPLANTRAGKFVLEKNSAERGPLLQRCFALFAAKPQALAWAACSVG
jgi:hypothetical protein